MPVQKSYYKGQIVAKEPSSVLTAVMLIAMRHAMPMRDMARRSESVAHVSRSPEPPPWSGRDSVKCLGGMVSGRDQDKAGGGVL